MIARCLFVNGLILLALMNLISRSLLEDFVAKCDMEPNITYQSSQYRYGSIVLQPSNAVTLMEATFVWSRATAQCIVRPLSSHTRTKHDHQDIMCCPRIRHSYRVVVDTFNTDGVALLLTV
jgi:hypothetical protein